MVVVEAVGAPPYKPPPQKPRVRHPAGCSSVTGGGVSTLQTAPSEGWGAAPGGTHAWWLREDGHGGAVALHHGGRLLFQDGEDDGGGVLFVVVEAFGGFLEIARGGFEYVDEFLGVAVC